MRVSASSKSDARLLHLIVLRSFERASVVNARGYVGLRLRVTPDTRPGVVVVEGQRNRSGYLGGGSINVLTSDTLADMGGGATYQSTWVDVRRLDASLASRPD